ncbi:MULTISPECIES: glycosyltransferase [Ureibacillus]|jgi:teichuronic acid biosynthesis glycosyltransferase TuaC|uniref:Glycosyltransferase involved in cell wall biosynthesis n=1 Tax=Ureibacillus thermosphaericus TaxID=51173 RepID=A0A840PUZ1_URETH|nr:glycosyltransferase [Ureibacillus thermosphaericus]MBB5149064.1 glycosyltransferase involved in cell wall biosynthesis [Ureibacillus thermosphaericus]NKZ31828.1 glycosyltransferase family 4 protein [Ureibacillus thermosphaericus]
MKKVFVISNMYPSKEHLSFGIFVKNQVEALRNSNIDVIVAANDNPKTGKKNTILKYSKWAKEVLSKALKYKKEISITHAHYVFPSGVFSFMMKKMFNIPYVVTAHGGDIERMAKKSASIRNWTEKILQESSYVIAVGPVLADQIEKDYGIPRDRILVCSMGVNRQQFKPGNKEIVRKELNLDDDAFIYLFVGNVIKQKGVEELLIAFQQVKKEANRKVKLVIIGSQRDRSFVNSLSPLMDDDVLMYGPMKQNELVKWYQASDVFVLPSHLEGFGLVALEAIASGTPVIASDVGGLTYLLKDGAGHLVEPKNPKALADEMFNALTTPKEQYTNQEACDEILHIHDADEITKRVIRLYESAVNGGSSL